MTFISDVLQPGGGVKLIPFVKFVICILLLLTTGAFVGGFARIHMAVLSFLCSGLLISLQFFESELTKISRARSRTSKSTNSGKELTRKGD